MFQITEHKIEGNGRAGMPQMRITIDGGTADIHADMRGVKGLEALLLTRQSIINNQF
jgi:MoaA/NifB/PqqE/SkfB family radical SAM enzyme